VLKQDASIIEANIRVLVEKYGVFGGAVLAKYLELKG
jgi:hypothetical protein